MGTGADRGKTAEGSSGIRRSCPPSPDYYKACRAALKAPDSPARDFLREINIRPETAVQAGLGYDPAWVGFPYPDPGPAIIIPLRAQDYQAYRLHSDRNPWGVWGIERAWNLGLMFTEGLHFITSGVFDALAIRECGWDACAVLGAGNDNRFLMELGERDWTPDPDSAYIIAFGHNKVDKTGAVRLAEELRQRGAAVFIADLNGSARRVFEAHRDNPERFREETEKAVREAVESLRADGADVPDTWLEKKKSFTKPSLRLPGRRLRKAEDLKTEQQYLKMCQQLLWEADGNLQKRFEKSGIRYETGLAAGLGVDLEKSGTDADDPLSIIVPLPKKQHMVLEWGNAVRSVDTTDEPVWPKQRFTDAGVIYITRDVPDALVAMENGQQAVCLFGDVQALVDWLDAGRWPVSHKAVYVIALGSSAEDIQIADELLKAFKAHNRTATRAAIRGDSDSLQEEYRRDPEIVKKRFAVATQKCQNVLAAQAAQKAEAAKKAAAKWRKAKKHQQKRRPRPQ